MNHKLVAVQKIIHLFGYLFTPNMFSNQTYRQGVTSLTGDFDIKTKFGSLRASVFYDDVHKDYVIAVSNLKDLPPSAPLHTRIHSSCVTSESLGAMDCDCVEQLNGALEIIAKEGGILYYLMQEGRGAGYPTKARGRELEEATGMGTYDAYQHMGAKTDYREYTIIKDITRYLLGDTEPRNWVLLTNNPHKTESFKALDLGPYTTKKIEFTPNPHNTGYLVSKQKVGGHTLDKVQDLAVTTDEKPPLPVTVTEQPIAIPGTPFVREATYFLPIRPEEGLYTLTQERFQTLFSAAERLLLKPVTTQTGLYKKDSIRIDATQTQDPAIHALLEKYHGALAERPYWFKTEVYTDKSHSNRTLIMMHYNTEGLDPSTPLPVRVQSESVLNRFPLEETPEKQKLRDAMAHIVRKEQGVILFYPDDARGCGLGKVVYNIESRTPLKPHEDRRDYELLKLIQLQFPINPIQFLTQTGKTRAFKEAVEHYLKPCEAPQHPQVKPDRVSYISLPQA